MPGCAWNNFNMRKQTNHKVSCVEKSIMQNPTKSFDYNIIQVAYTVCKINNTFLEKKKREGGGGGGGLRCSGNNIY